MSKQQTVTVGGVTYDAHTGLRVEAVVSDTENRTSSEPAKGHAAHALHARTRRSETLNRDHVKSPASSPAKVAPARRPQIERSDMISKFAKHPQVANLTKPRRVMQDIAPASHPLVQKVKAAQPATSSPAAVLPPAKVLKEQAISKALANSSQHEASLQKKQRRRPRMVSIASASLALVLLAGYLTYLNLPTLSVRVAAAQAGIAATYPSYHPQGYDLNGPVAYANGQVTMEFASNTGPQNFSVNQTKSTWDSSALLTNYVEPTVGENYTAYHDSGLTIYVYEGKAAWVNNGILHTIEGSASLSNDQVRRIATSM